jgi:hypothetical protein
MSNPIYGFFKNNVYRNFLAKLNPTPDYDVTLTLSNTTTHTDTITCTIDSNLWANQTVYMDVTGGGTSDANFTDDNSRTAGQVDGNGNLALSKTIDVYSNISMSNFGTATVTLRTGDADIGDIIFTDTVTTRSGTNIPVTSGSNSYNYNNKDGYNYTFFLVNNVLSDGTGTHTPSSYVARKIGMPVDYLAVGAGVSETYGGGGGGNVQQGTFLINSGTTVSINVGSSGFQRSQGNTSSITGGAINISAPGGNSSTASQNAVLSDILTPRDSSYYFGAGYLGSNWSRGYTYNPQAISGNQFVPGNLSATGFADYDPLQNTNTGFNGVVIFRSPTYENFFQ